MKKDIFTKYGLYCSIGLIILSLIVYSCTNNFDEFLPENTTGFEQDRKTLNKQKNNLDYTLAGIMHNEFLDCMTNQINSWNEPQDIYEISEINAMLWEASTNCSFQWYSPNQKLQFSFDEIFRLDFLNQVVEKIMLSNAFSPNGKEIIRTLTSYYFKEKNPSDEFLIKLIEKFEKTKFYNNTEKQVIGSLLYITKGSTEYWSKNEYIDMNDEEIMMAIIPLPVAWDLAGGLFSVGRDALDGELSPDKIDDHIVSSVVASAGAVGKVGKWIQSFFK